MIGHVGNRVGALVDGQLPAELSERLWSHVHKCLLCRQAVEREGWVKTRLAGLASGGSQPQPPNYLASLLTDPPARSGSEAEAVAASPPQRPLLAVMVGAGSVGAAAVVGVLALTLPADPSAPVRRPPTSSLTGTPVPARVSQGPTAPAIQGVGGAVADRSRHGGASGEAQPTMAGAGITGWTMAP